MSDIELGFVGSARYLWRQLTSMRTALILLLLTGLAAIPGSLLPQRTNGPIPVQDYFKANPELAKFLDKLWMFDVYMKVLEYSFGLFQNCFLLNFSFFIYFISFYIFFLLKVLKF